MNQTSPSIVLNEGKTFHYLIPVILLAIAAIISFVFFIPAGILLSITCIGFAMIESGLEFRLETMEYRRFKSLFGISRGKWVAIKQPRSFHLRLSVESHTYRVPMMSNPTFYGRSTRVQSKSITYHLTTQTANKIQIDIYEFQSYKTARILLKHLQRINSLEVIDHIALKLEENQRRRMNRMR